MPPKVETYVCGPRGGIRRKRRDGRSSYGILRSSIALDVLKKIKCYKFICGPKGGIRRLKPDGSWSYVSKSSKAQISKSVISRCSKIKTKKKSIRRQQISPERKKQRSPQLQMLGESKEAQRRRSRQQDEDKNYGSVVVHVDRKDNRIPYQKVLEKAKNDKSIQMFIKKLPKIETLLRQLKQETGNWNKPFGFDTAALKKHIGPDHSQVNRFLATGGNWYLASMILISMDGNACLSGLFSLKWELDPTREFLINEDKVKSAIEHCENSLMAINLYLVVRGDRHGHANVLIVDFKSKIVTRYDPHLTTLDMFKPAKLDAALTTFFASLDLKYDNSKLCVKGAQAFEAEEKRSNKDFGIQNPLGGNCSIWTVWFLHMRLLANRNISDQKLEKEQVDLLRENCAFWNTSSTQTYEQILDQYEFSSLTEFITAYGNVLYDLISRVLEAFQPGLTPEKEAENKFIVKNSDKIITYLMDPSKREQKIVNLMHRKMSRIRDMQQK